MPIPASRPHILSLLVAATLASLATPAAAQQQRFDPLKIEGQTLLSGDRPVRALMVCWHWDPMGTPEQELRAEMVRMRDEFKFQGFMAEVGWNTIEPAEGTFVFPPQIDRAIEIAREEGLWVTLLPTAHYTPNWVYTRWGDVKMKDEQGRSVDGLWLNYSPSSPAALEGQVRFQRAFVAHYAPHENLLGFHLTNELAYGNQGWADYSRWAEDAWGRWRAAQGLAPTSLPRPSEAGARPADWAAFCRFRQDALNTYFDTLYREVTPVLPRFIPVYHRHNWYTHSDAFAAQRGLYLDPVTSLGDSTGGNLYGSNAIIEGQMQAWQRPMILTETNVAGGQPTSGAINEMYLGQLFAGSQVQHVYHWGPGGVLPIRDAARQVLPAYARLAEVAELTAAIPGRDLSVERLAGFLWARNQAAQRSGEYWHLQQPLSEAMAAQRQAALTPVTIYPSFLEPGKAPGRLMERVRLLYAPHHLGLDQDPVEDPRLRDWVAAGGTLVVEVGPGSQVPAWSGITTRGTNAARFSAAAGAFAAGFRAVPKGDFSFAFDVGQSDEVWATWDGSGQAAILARSVGQGRIVAVGTYAFGRLDAELQPLVRKLGALAHPSDPSLEAGFDVRSLGPHRMISPLDRAQARTFTVPAAWSRGGGYHRLMDRATGAFSAPVAFGPGAQLVSIPADHLLVVVVTDPVLPPGSTPPPVAAPATPTIHVRGSWFRARIELRCATAGAQVRYTLDGSDPSASSPVYRSEITVRRTTTVRARAFLSGAPASAIASQRAKVRLGRGWWKLW